MIVAQPAKMIVAPQITAAPRENIGRPMPHGLRELLVSRGRTGYLALYSFDERHDAVLMLAIRHRREDDYH